MPLLGVEITEVVDDSFPVFVRCVVVDAEGRRHEIIEKLPVVGGDDELPTGDASVACTLVEVRRDEHGRRVVRVDISRPWGCETVEGLTLLDVFEDQLSLSEARSS